jgi:hypothetical protein
MEAAKEIIGGKKEEYQRKRERDKDSKESGKL